jgi:hypothetical protein
MLICYKNNANNYTFDKKYKTSSSPRRVLFLLSFFDLLFTLMHLKFSFKYIIFNPIHQTSLFNHNLGHLLVNIRKILHLLNYYWNLFVSSMKLEVILIMLLEILKLFRIFKLRFFTLKILKFIQILFFN